MQYIHTYIHPSILLLSGFCPRLPGWASIRRNIHTYCGHQSSLICFIYLLRSMASSLFNPHAWQSFSTISLQFFLVYLLAWHPPLHTPYISSPNH